MRVVIVAESGLAAEAIRRALRYSPNCEVVGYIDGRRACAQPLAASRPDVVLIHDLSAPGGTLERIAEARLAVPGARVLLLSHSMDAEWLNEAREAGIHAAIARDVAATSLATLVREIGSGTVFHAFAPPPASNGVAEMTDQLTARELQILRLVTSGASNSRIAAELWVTEQTVKFHLSNTYRKLGVANRTQAAHYAHLHGLLASTRGPDPAPAVSPTAVAA